MYFVIIFIWRLYTYTYTYMYLQINTYTCIHTHMHIYTLVVFLEFFCLFYDPVDVGNLISGSSAFSKISLNVWNFTDQILLKLGLEILNIGQGGLACCDSWGRKESDMTERLNWTKLSVWNFGFKMFIKNEVQFNI